MKLNVGNKVALRPEFTPTSALKSAAKRELPKAKERITHLLGGEDGVVEPKLKQLVASMARREGGNRATTPGANSVNIIA